MAVHLLDEGIYLGGGLGIYFLKEAQRGVYFQSGGYFQ